MTKANWFTNPNSNFWTMTNDEMEDTTTLTDEDIRFLLATAIEIDFAEGVATYTAELARRTA